MNAQVGVNDAARSNVRRILISLIVVGFVSAAAASTFATFNAQTANPATIANATVKMSNVVGTSLGGTDCTTGVAAGDTTCKVIFTANNTDSTAALTTGQTNLKPGDATPATNSIVVTYTGSLTTSKFRLFASAYATKAGSSSTLCTAVNPGSQLQFQVKQGSTIIYPTGGVGFGTLDEFSTTYTSTANGLALKGGTNGSGSADVWNTSDSTTFTINVKLAAVDNTYQGCQSTATFAFYAEQ
jgi:hypothetical protein